jgi:crotonobetainyl-CoA:carnitine CoA-transferase CaiB-like acyl-CoA transferase
MTLSRSMLPQIWTALGGPSELIDRVEESGAGSLPSVFRVSDLASASVGAAALAVAEFIATVHGEAPKVRVDRRLASLWFAASLRPVGWAPPPLWDPIAGDYRSRDGWIRLHTNAPAHRAAALAVLGTGGDRSAVAQAVLRWSSDDLEAAVVAAGGCAATMRSMAEWAAHPQGSAVAAEPIIHLQPTPGGQRPHWRIEPGRPLGDVRILDLTRVLAGPVATRFLAGYGAQVLRIDPPDWDEPGMVPEISPGKRCARLDLRASKDRAIFERLLMSADVFVHGYRPGALAGLGYDAQSLQSLRPGLIDVSLDAYGQTGPWKDRRGFDSLVQMSTGIAAEGMTRGTADRPVPLPVQALDQATGYLMAAAVVRGLTGRLVVGAGLQARASLARTAALLMESGGNESTQGSLAPEVPEDLQGEVEHTQWGPAHRLVAPISIEGCSFRWSCPAASLGSASAQW